MAKDNGKDKEKGKGKGGRDDYRRDKPHGLDEPERESYDDPEVHREIERQRFRGGLPATPELYARALEQWNRLPGSIVRPPMNPVGDSTPGEKHPRGQAQADGKEGQAQTDGKEIEQ